MPRAKPSTVPYTVSWMVSHRALSTAGAVKYWANAGQSQPGLVTSPLMNCATTTRTAIAATHRQGCRERTTVRAAGSADGASNSARVDNVSAGGSSGGAVVDAGFERCDVVTGLSSGSTTPDTGRGGPMRRSAGIGPQGTGGRSSRKRLSAADESARRGGSG